MQTEEKAREKWCPMARVSDTGGGNRYPHVHDLANGHAFARCLASDCAAWRWANDSDGEPSYHRTKIGEGHYDNAPLGYCGLAGAPQ